MSPHCSGKIARQIVVLVPAAMIELNEPHAALGKSPREQAVRRDSSRASVTSGPYISNVLAGSFDRSINSGTEVCMRYAISYWRDARLDLRVAILLGVLSVQLRQRIEHAPARRPR